MASLSLATVEQNQVLLRKRLLHDIAELQQKPYPGIALHVNDQDTLQHACLILSPENEPPLHLTIEFTHSYPLSPPIVKCQSLVHHPNVFGDGSICASILRNGYGYTSAYTLKGICIQLVSFFSSDTIEQEHGFGPIDRKKWIQKESGSIDTRGFNASAFFACSKCGFPDKSTQNQSVNGKQPATVFPSKQDGRPTNPDASLWRMPPEIVLNITDFLDDQELFQAAKGWPGLSAVIRRHNVIRTRELQCFTLKQSFRDTILGIGVTVRGKTIESEFDLLSYVAFSKLGVRVSVQAMPFKYWMPLPISRLHWLQVRSGVDERLEKIAKAANITGSPITTLYAFMSDIVVRLSREVSEVQNPQSRFHDHLYGDVKSTLGIVSEKAIESYFHLLHLLICHATDRPEIVQQADRTIKSFIEGGTDKKSVPNLGHLLIMVLISSRKIDQPLLKTIIQEAVTRNVVWMFDPKGQNMPELSYLETDAISKYRLEKTFEASKTSYRLLMSANLMRKEVAAMSSSANREHMTLQQLRDTLFARHGAPPNGAASRLAVSVKRIQGVSSFPEFLQAMDISPIPSASEFTTFLRRTVTESANKGYSKFALTQKQALAMRLQLEPDVGRDANMHPEKYFGKPSFFPNDRNRRRR